MDALAALIERVEAGGPTSLGFWREIFRPALGSPDTTLFLNFIAAVRDGSLNTAVAFTEALLPGWDWCIAKLMVESGNTEFSADVGPPSTLQAVSAKAPTPALALVLASLKAFGAKT